MSGAVKQLAVVAVAVAVASFTGGAGGFFATSLGVGATTATVLGSIAGAVVAAVAGKAIGLGKVNIEDAQPISSYATSSLSNETNNNNVVPTIYGETRVGGNRVFADLVADADLYEIIAFASHECEDYVSLFAGNELMTQGTGGDTDKWRSDNDNVLAQVYTIKGTPITAITSFSGPSTWNTSNMSSLSFQNITFLDTNVPDGISFIVVHHHFDATNYNQRKQITARIKGKKVRLLTNDTTIGSTPTYSNNPTEIILDFLTDSANFNEIDSKIDVASFFTSKTLNDTNSFSCNLAFTAKTTLSAAIQELKATNRSDLIYSQGIWKIKQDEKNKTIEFAITGDDIISGTFAWSQKKARDIANKIIVSWINPDDQWQTLQEPFEDTDLQASDGRIYTKEVQLRGVTNLPQAQIFSELMLNQFRYTENEAGDRIAVTPLIVKFTTTIKNSALEVGDMGTIDYFELPNIKQFVIMSINTKQSGELDITLREYASTHYKDTNGNFII